MDGSEDFDLGNCLRSDLADEVGLERLRGELADVVDVETLVDELDSLDDDVRDDLGCLEDSFDCS